MRGFTSVVRLPLFLIVVFTISAAAQEQPENNQFNGLDYTLQKPAKNERYAKKKFGDHLFISGEAGLILDRSAGSLFATPGLGLRAGLTVGDWFSPVHGMRVGLNAGLHNGLAGVNPYFVGLSAECSFAYSMALCTDWIMAAEDSVAPDIPSTSLWIASSGERLFHCCNRPLFRTLAK